MSEDNKMNKKAVKLVIGLIISGLIAVLFATYMIFIQANDYKKASKAYKDTANQYVSMSRDIIVTRVEPTENLEDRDKTVDDWEIEVDVDMAGLQNMNEDIVGWIYFENLDISYPVLYSGDDSTYLRRNHLGENVQAGSIFMEGENSKDFSDAHTIIYGHNMKDLSMFGKLRYYFLDDSFIENHEYFQIITKDKKYRYKIISYKLVSDDSSVYTIYKTGDQNFLYFAKGVLQKGNYVDSDYNMSSDDHLITLSTCLGEDRFVVSAVRCDESY